jgi:hypothetical protein
VVLADGQEEMLCRVDAATKRYQVNFVPVPNPVQVLEYLGGPAMHGIAKTPKNPRAG